MNINKEYASAFKESAEQLIVCAQEFNKIDPNIFPNVKNAVDFIIDATNKYNETVESMIEEDFTLNPITQIAIGLSIKGINAFIEGGSVHFKEYCAITAYYDKDDGGVYLNAIIKFMQAANKLYKNLNLYFGLEDHYASIYASNTPNGTRATEV